VTERRIPGTAPAPMQIQFTVRRIRNGYILLTSRGVGDHQTEESFAPSLGDLAEQVEQAARSRLS
jgi:hypothetical protein